MLFKSSFPKIEPSSVKRHVSVNGFAQYLSFWVQCKPNSHCGRERECSKPAGNHQTVITNRLQETLVLAKKTQNNEKVKIVWKASLFALTNDLLVI